MGPYDPAASFHPPPAPTTEQPPPPVSVLRTMDSPPVPLTLTVTGFLSRALEGLSKVPLAAPDAVGANRKVRVQLADGARVLPEQPSVADGMLNGAASGFADATVPITRLAVPLFVTVTVWSGGAPTA